MLQGSLDLRDLVGIFLVQLTQDGLEVDLCDHLFDVLQLLLGNCKLPELLGNCKLPATLNPLPNFLQSERGRLQSLLGRLDLRCREGTASI